MAHGLNVSTITHSPKQVASSFLRWRANEQKKEAKLKAKATK